jgi:hypothetical protein
MPRGSRTPLSRHLLHTPAVEVEGLTRTLAWLFVPWKDGMPNRPLSDEDTKRLLSIVVDLLDGVDPRRRLGIKSKRGRTPSPTIQLRHERIAGHYWALRIQNGEKDAVARRLVKQSWGVGTDMVWKLARTYEDAWRERLQDEYWSDAANLLARLADRQD